MDIFVNNETSELEAVILGIGTDRGKTRAINPTIRKHLKENTAPTETSILREIKTFENVLKENGVQVYRPNNIPQIDQIFTRDIGFVIEDYFFISNMKYPERSAELAGINYILESIERHNIVKIPKEITIEGGDVILWDDYVFVGQGDRTSKNAIPFLQEVFPKKIILGFDLVVDQNSVNNNILHLDCAFQPIGHNEAIIYYDGFKSRPDNLLELFPNDKLIEVTLAEKNQMFPNIFSISPSKIVIEKGFNRLQQELSERNFETFEVDYSETSKMSGLLRCSTLPLKRKPSKITH